MVTEIDLIEAHLSLDGFHWQGFRSVLNFGRRIDDLEYPLRSSQRCLDRIIQVSQLA